MTHHRRSMTVAPFLLVAASCTPAPSLNHDAAAVSDGAVSDAAATDVAPGSDATTSGLCAGTAVFCDDFSATAPPAAYTTMSGTWTRAAGSYTVVATGSGQRAAATIDGDATDVDVTIHARSVGDAGFGVVYALQADGSGLAVVVHTGQYRGVYLKRLGPGLVDATGLLMASMDALAPDTDYTLRVQRHGTSVVVSLDGAMVLSGDDGSPGVHGRVGLLVAVPAQPSGSARFGLFRIDTESTTTSTMDAGVPDGATPDAAPPGDGGATRDPWLRPFTPSSIWNMPIGSAADYQPANLPMAGGVGYDRSILLRQNASDPLQPLYDPMSWGHRCGGTVDSGRSFHLPNGFVIGDATADSTPNNLTDLLRPDGRYVDTTNGSARCDGTGPIYGYTTHDPRLDVFDLYGDGQLGGHGATRLNGLGGLIRPGELDASAPPINHALDLVLYMHYFYWGGSSATAYRWPAISADSYASATTYAGSNPKLRTGALLAIRPSETEATAGVTTTVGQRIFHALQDYGGYVTDDSAWDYYYVSVDGGMSESSPTPAEAADINRLIARLYIVDNNSPTSIGGGGTPRRPLLAPLPPAP